MILITTCPATKEGWNQENPELKRERIEINNRIAFLKRGRHYGKDGWEFHFFNDPFDGATFWYFCEGDIVITQINKNTFIYEYDTFPKDEAIALMKAGKKLTHIYFSKGEWVTMTGNIIKMEMGQECWASEFWENRQGIGWENGWSLYEE